MRSRTERVDGVIVFGAGDMGARHAAHWQSAGVRVVAVCDPAVERAAATADPFGALAVATPDEALALGGAQVASVCTPTFLHAPLTVRALDAGLHVLCEKPAALTLGEAEAMRDAAARNDRELRIGFMRRFDPAHAQLFDAVGRIGRPVLAQATIAAGIRPKLLMHDAEANGGPVIDMCCHVFNLWASLFGEQATLVNAHGYTFSESKPELASIRAKALDSAHITLEYPGGSIGQIQVSWGLPSGVEATERHTYMGPDGLVTVNWNRTITLRTSGGTNRWTTSGTDPWREQIHWFRRELTEGAPVRVGTIDDGIEALRVSLAVLHSVKERRPIRPLEAAPAAPSFDERVVR